MLSERLKHIDFLEKFSPSNWTRPLHWSSDHVTRLWRWLLLSRTTFHPEWTLVFVWIFSCLGAALKLLCFSAVLNTGFLECGFLKAFFFLITWIYKIVWKDLFAILLWLLQTPQVWTIKKPLLLTWLWQIKVAGIYFGISVFFLITQNLAKQNGIRA